MRTLILILIISPLFCLSLTAIARSLDVRAELIWVDSNNNRSRVMFSQLIDQQWSTPLSIYNSKHYITTPSLNTDNNNNKFAVWSEQRGNSTILMSSRRSPEKEKWEQGQKINDFEAENLSPSLIVDSNNQLWVFWSSNHDGLDDIYYSRQLENKWSEPQRVHSKNKVPDIQPIAGLNEDQNVVVAWKTYDLQSGQYLTVEREFEFDKSSRNRYKVPLSNINEESISDLVLPDFLPSNSSIELHFPNNKIEQSIRLNLNR